MSRTRNSRSTYTQQVHELVLEAIRSDDVKESVVVSKKLAQHVCFVVCIAFHLFLAVDLRRLPDAFGEYGDKFKRFLMLCVIEVLTYGMTQKAHVFLAPWVLSSSQAKSDQAFEKHYEALITDQRNIDPKQLMSLVMNKKQAIQERITFFFMVVLSTLTCRVFEEVSRLHKAFDEAVFYPLLLELFITGWYLMSLYFNRLAFKQNTELHSRAVRREVFELVDSGLTIKGKLSDEPIDNLQLALVLKASLGCSDQRATLHEMLLDLIQQLWYEVTGQAIFLVRIDGRLVLRTPLNSASLHKVKAKENYIRHIVRSAFTSGVKALEALKQLKASGLGKWGMCYMIAERKLFFKKGVADKKYRNFAQRMLDEVEVTYGIKDAKLFIDSKLTSVQLDRLRRVGAMLLAAEERDSALPMLSPLIPEPTVRQRRYGAPQWRNGRGKFVLAVSSPGLFECKRKSWCFNEAADLGIQEKMREDNPRLIPVEKNGMHIGYAWSLLERGNQALNRIIDGLEQTRCLRVVSKRGSQGLVYLGGGRYKLKSLSRGTGAANNQPDVKVIGHLEGDRSKQLFLIEKPVSHAHRHSVQRARYH